MQQLSCESPPQHFLSTSKISNFNLHFLIHLNNLTLDTPRDMCKITLINLSPQR